MHCVIVKKSKFIKKREAESLLSTIDKNSNTCPIINFKKGKNCCYRKVFIPIFTMIMDTLRKR